MTKQMLFAAVAAVLIGGTLSASARDAIVIDEAVFLTEPVANNVKYYNTWRDGWFIQAGAGINYPIMEGFRHNKKYIGATYNLAFGRRFSPYFGFRISGYYGNIAEGQNNGTLHYRQAAVNADIMWDMLNSVAGVSQTRRFSIVPFVGIGGSYNHHFGGVTQNINVYDDGHRRSNSWTLPVSAGMQFRIMLCSVVDLFFESRVSFAGDNFNNIVGGKPIDMLYQSTAGFVFNIGQRTFNTYSPSTDAAYMAMMNNRVNDLREELAVTAAALAVAESQLPCPEVAPPAPPVNVTTVVPAPSPMLATVRFTINSAHVSSTEMVNVYNVAQYMKQNPKVNVTITGYADKDTGTGDYNRELSMRRAQAVYDLLTQTYGISPNRLKTVAEGSSVQPYDTNNWNRIVIFSND